MPILNYYYFFWGVSFVEYSTQPFSPFVSGQLPNEAHPPAISIKKWQLFASNKSLANTIKLDVNRIDMIKQSDRNLEVLSFLPRCFLAKFASHFIL